MDLDAEDLELLKRLANTVTDNGKTRKETFLMRCAILLTFAAPQYSPFTNAENIAEYFNKSLNYTNQTANNFGFVKDKDFPELVNEEGLIIKPQCLSVFCRERKLCYSSIISVLNGRRKSCNGWRLYNPNEERIFFDAIEV